MISSQKGNREKVVRGTMTRRTDKQKDQITIEKE